MCIKELLKKDSYSFDDLCEIMKILRSDGGCPWDREQTHKSIRNEFIEEVYEAIEGIDKEDNDILKEELGDVLLQVVFHARIAEEDGVFDINSVSDGICKKMILRHPHIFSDVTAETTEKVLENWDEIKKTEKNQKSAADTLKAVSSALPSLVRASKLQSKAAKCGFTYKDANDALTKAQEELGEVSRAISEGEKNHIAEEIGDLLFAVANIARLAGINPEEALYKSNDKFISRFSKMENLCELENLKLCELNVNEMLAFWEKSKKN